MGREVIKHTVKIVHETEGEDGIKDPEAFADTDESEVRRIRHWLYQSLRHEDCKPARALLSMFDEAYIGQAYEAGKRDAFDPQWASPQISASAHPLWRDSYHEGWADGMSELFEERQRS